MYSAVTLSAMRGLVSLEQLGEARAPEPESWPKLSVLVPACNEAGTLGQALETLLAQDYPALEIVLVNDRSTDSTGQVVDELAGRDPRITAVHVSELPPKWLGKVHALSRGYERSRGELVLFTDADVHYQKPDVLRRAVALAVARRLDHVCCLPDLRSGSFWQAAAVDAFGIGFFANLRVHELVDPESERYVGVGAFNLVRRAALERSEGLEWLRMEVGDDVGLGFLLRRAKGRAGLWLAASEIGVLWYPSLREMSRGLEKNLFAIMGHYSVLRVFMRVALAFGMVGGMVAALFSPHLPVAALGGFAWCMVVATAVVLHRRLGQRVGPALLAPLGVLMVCVMALNSTWRCRAARGITWRGTHYPLDELRGLQRVKL